ncbi:hypothetical protein [Croceiramulus getboli]|nr:hypothetical protein P8624_05230 [Flavobacteriaceae bacterium YJPT1-3]
MRKDISIPQVKNVYMAALYQYNEAHRTHDWNIIMINSGAEPLEQVLIVSRGQHQEQRTSILRHQIKLLPAHAFAKAEFLIEAVLALDNEFLATWFIGNTLYEKTFRFPAGTIKKENLKPLAVLDQQGILAD